MFVSGELLPIEAIAAAQQHITRQGDHQHHQ